jgi:hypothetical protein
MAMLVITRGYIPTYDCPLYLEPPWGLNIEAGSGTIVDPLWLLLVLSSNGNAKVKQRSKRSKFLNKKKTKKEHSQKLI